VNKFALAPTDAAELTYWHDAVIIFLVIIVTSSVFLNPSTCPVSAGRILEWAGTCFTCTILLPGDAL